MSSLSLRRSIVAAVAIASLFGGAAVIRAAAGWTADAASLAEKPPDPAKLVAQLQDEQARAGTLTDQLVQVTSQATELQAALVAAQEKAKRDAMSADELSSQLAAAQARLANLERQLAAAAAAPAPVVTVAGSGSGASTGGSGESEAPEEHHEDDD